MLTFSTRSQFVIGITLVLLLIGTRGHHFATLYDLPGASWAVFFLAGVYLRLRWALPGLLALTWVLDFVAYTWGGVSGFCLTPAYVFLLRAYGALWLTGCWYAGQYRFEWRTLLPLAGAMLVGAVICELFSSGGFYFFSGRFAETSFLEFGGRLQSYFPGSLQSVTFYVGIAAVVHMLFGLASRVIPVRNTTEA